MFCIAKPGNATPLKIEACAPHTVNIFHHNIIIVWQSEVDNGHYSVIYFDCVAAFEALYL